MCELIYTIPFYYELENDPLPCTKYTIKLGGFAWYFSITSSLNSGAGEKVMLVNQPAELQ